MCVDVCMGMHRYKSAADLMLDALRYNAHSTATDVLWAGVPILSLAGEGVNMRT